MTGAQSSQQNTHSPRIAFIVSGPRASSLDFHGLFSGYQWESLRGKILRAGISPEACEFIGSREVNPEVLKSKECGIFVTLGEDALRLVTSKRGIDKWQLSPLETHEGFRCKKVIPTFDMARVNVQFELGLYQELAIRRAVEESKSSTYSRAPEKFRLDPSLGETLALLDYIKEQPIVSIDVETGYGQINTVGFAWSESDAIAINVLPDRLNSTNNYELWQKIRAVLEGPTLKVFQNFSYDVMYFSAYGCHTRNIYHDTMWAMKFLYPELDMNLGNVGRIYTNRPYWKDDGKVESEEGKKKDWGNVRDWNKHYLYNCRDTTGTFEAHINQRADLKKRNLLGVFDNYFMKLAEPVLEMCSNGMPISLEVKERLRTETEARVVELTKQLYLEAGRELNPNSPKQVMQYLKDCKVKLPMKYNKKEGISKESTDSSSIKKIRLKHPELISLGTLAEIKELKTSLSRYINFDVKPGEEKLRYTIGRVTETLRFAGGTDPWDRGFNIQTIPRGPFIKQMFVAPEGCSFIEIDLRQAESRFVAYDAADKTLIDMLESGADVHSYVTNEILFSLGMNPKDIPKEEYKNKWRQLGKKSGHGANYSMKANVFVETCFNDNIEITRNQAQTILDAYYRLFPGIPRWHNRIKKELYEKRKLTAPSGWERYFYGRYNDDMFKEAFAWRPQHTIPWITNHLMLHLLTERKRGKFSFKLLVQVHDSLILLAPDGNIGDIAKVCLNTKDWHPCVTLEGGVMVIPTEVKAGKTMSELEEIFI